MMKKSWEKKVDNKGFTLVELIVVLVILAILAAILVPALLGYIDRAKGSQILLNGKSVLTASQAEMSNKYGTVSAGAVTNDLATDDDFIQKIATTADIPAGASFAFKTGGSDKAVSDKHDCWTVMYVAYTEDGDKAIFYDGTSKSWEEDTFANVKTKITNASGSSAFAYGSFK